MEPATLSVWALKKESNNDPFDGLGAIGCRCNCTQSDRSDGYIRLSYPASVNWVEKVQGFPIERMYPARSKAGVSPVTGVGIKGVYRLCTAISLHFLHPLPRKGLRWPFTAVSTGSGGCKSLAPYLHPDSTQPILYCQRAPPHGFSTDNRASALLPPKQPE